MYTFLPKRLTADCFEAIVHDLRALLRKAHGRAEQPRAVVLDGRTLQSTPESGARTGFDGAKKKKGSKVHMAVDTLGHLLALLVTPANEQKRVQASELAAQVQETTSQTVTLAYVDQGYTGEDATQDAAEQGLRLEVVERSFAWAGRFRRLARDYERLPETLAGLHFIAFACLMLVKAASAILPKSA